MSTGRWKVIRTVIVILKHRAQLTTSIDNRRINFSSSILTFLFDCVKFGNKYHWIDYIHENNQIFPTSDQSRFACEPINSNWLLIFNS